MSLTSRTPMIPRRPYSFPRPVREVRRPRGLRHEVASPEGRTLLSTLYAVGSGVGNGSSEMYKSDNDASAPNVAASRRPGAGSGSLT